MNKLALWISVLNICVYASSCAYTERKNPPTPSTLSSNGNGSGAPTDGLSNTQPGTGGTAEGNAANTGGDTANPAPNSQATPMVFSKIQKDVLMPNCVKCHNASKTKGGVDMTDYSKLMAADTDSGMAIVPGKPSDSVLYQDLLDGSMPDQAAKLPDNLIQEVHDWIQNEAANG